MQIQLDAIGQIALPVSDVDRAERFFSGVLGLKRLYRFGDLSFFDCAGLRLLLEKATDPARMGHGAVLYFRCADIGAAARELKTRGLHFRAEPHLVARMPDHDLWMAFFDDPDGHLLALMHEAPQGYAPAAD